jgi:tetratricopeptide (TPR) repeat protein
MRQDLADRSERFERCRLAVAESPGSAAAHLNLGTALLGIDRPKEAEAEFRRALELRADFAEALVNLGGLLLHRWDFRGCVDLNRRAAEAKPGLMIAHYNEGLGHLYLGEAKEMVACFQRALELDSSHAGVHYHLAVGLLALGQVSESEAHLSVALEGGFSPAPEFLKALEKAHDRPVSPSGPTDRLEGEPPQRMT